MRTACLLPHIACPVVAFLMHFCPGCLQVCGCVDVRAVAEMSAGPDGVEVPQSLQGMVAHFLGKLLPKPSEIQCGMGEKLVKLYRARLLKAASTSASF